MQNFRLEFSIFEFNDSTLGDSDVMLGGSEIRMDVTVFITLTTQFMIVMPCSFDLQ